MDSERLPVVQGVMTNLESGNDVLLVFYSERLPVVQGVMTCETDKHWS